VRKRFNQWRRRRRLCGSRERYTTREARFFSDSMTCGAPVDVWRCQEFCGWWHVGEKEAKK
jgi:hypothetical protein